jgi:glucose/arabinose dehydrogenase
MFGGLRWTRFATRRTIVDGPVRGGENNGLAVLPNGRILMAVSASCDHCTPASPYSGSIVSFRPDGSDLRIYARRIRAAYGLELYPHTATLFATLNQRDDLGAATRGDGLAVVRAGDDWKFPGCYRQGGAACVGVPPPVGVLDKHAAAAGVAIVIHQLRGRFASSALVAEWQLGRVVARRAAAHEGRFHGEGDHILDRHGEPVANSDGARWLNPRRRLANRNDLRDHRGAAVVSCRAESCRLAQPGRTAGSGGT